MASFNEVRSRVKPRVATVKVLLGADDLPDQYEKLDEELREVVSRSAADSLDQVNEITAIRDQMAELSARMDAESTVFKFQALPRTEWRKLIADHPPSREIQKKNPRAEWDPVTFMPAALSACCVDPEMTVDEAAELMDMLTEAQFNDVWITCYSVNVRSDIPKSDLASRFQPQRNGSVKPLTTTESPSPSSSDEL